MKILSIWLVVCLCLLLGCSANDTATSNSMSVAVAEAAPAAEDVIEIREKLFIAQINDIYYNANDYIGKAIKLEGVFLSTNYIDGEKFQTVVRYGPGCCGDDGNVGFEVTWDKEYPNPGDWVEAIGVLERYEEFGSTYLRLALSSLNVLSTRGTEYVLQ